MRKTAFLTAVIAMLGALSLVGLFAGGRKESEVPISLAISIPSPASPWQPMYKPGAEAYSKIAGLSLDVLSADLDSQKQLADIKAEIARTGGYVVFFVDPVHAADIVPIARMMEEAGVYWVSGRSKPVEVKVWDYPHWIAHMAFDGFAAGAFTATELLKSFKTPGQGTIIALQGALDDPSGAERWQGLQKVLTDNPGVQILQTESALGDTTKAHEAARSMLAAHPDVDGIWAENDDMATGAIQALKEAGLAGKVTVVGSGGAGEIVDAIKGGLAAAAVFDDGKYQAELSLAMALAARQGKLNVASMPHKYRMFEISATNVTRENAGQIEQDFIESTPAYDLSNFFARWSVALE